MLPGVDVFIYLDVYNWVQRVHRIYWVLAQDYIWCICINVSWTHFQFFPRHSHVSPLNTGLFELSLLEGSFWRMRASCKSKTPAFCNLAPLTQLISGELSVLNPKTFGWLGETAPRSSTRGSCILCSCRCCCCCCRRSHCCCRCFGRGGGGFGCFLSQYITLCSCPHYMSFCCSPTVLDVAGVSVFIKCVLITAWIVPRWICHRSDAWIDGDIAMQHFHKLGTSQNESQEICRANA